LNDIVRVLPVSDK